MYISKDHRDTLISNKIANFNSSVSRRVANLYTQQTTDKGYEGGRMNGDENVNDTEDVGRRQGG